MQKICKFFTIDFQLVIKKMIFFHHFFAEKFARFKKKQYLCSVI